MIVSPSLLRGVALLVVSFNAAGCSSRIGAADPTDRIRRAEAELARHPEHYLAAADLALAYLDAARRELDPTMLRSARAAARRSLAIQKNLRAYKAMAAIEGFAHHLEDSLRWAELARRTLPEDSEATALAVEALIGVGRTGDAHGLLTGLSDQTTDFFGVASQAAIARARGDDAAAARSYRRAADVAEAAKHPTLAAWALTMAARAWLDAGSIDLARIAVAHAERVDPNAPLVALHSAEVLAFSDPQRAAEVYADILRSYPDAEGYRNAMVLSHALGDRQQAIEYRRRAEAMLLPAVEAGEVYTLGELARLYRDAGVQRATAEALAEENLRHVRDREAITTLQSIRAWHREVAFPES